MPDVLERAAAVDDPVGLVMSLVHEQALRLRPALAGYDAQYDKRSIGEQHPELPSGCVERVEALVEAARGALSDYESVQAHRDELSYAIRCHRGRPRGKESDLQLWSVLP